MKVEEWLCYKINLDKEVDTSVLKDHVELNDDVEERPAEEDAHETAQTSRQIPDVVGEKFSLKKKKADHMIWQK